MFSEFLLKTFCIIAPFSSLSPTYLHTHTHTHLLRALPKTPSVFSFPLFSPKKKDARKTKNAANPQFPEKRPKVISPPSILCIIKSFSSLPHPCFPPVHILIHYCLGLLSLALCLLPPLLSFDGAGLGSLTSLAYGRGLVPLTNGSRCCRLCSSSMPASSPVWVRTSGIRPKGLLVERTFACASGDGERRSRPRSLRSYGERVDSGACGWGVRSW